MFNSKIKKSAIRELTFDHTITNKSGETVIETSFLNKIYLKNHVKSQKRENDKVLLITLSPKK